MVTKHQHTVAENARIVRRLLDGEAVTRLADEVDVTRSTLWRWQQEAHNLLVMPKKSSRRRCEVFEKASVVAEAAQLTGEELGGFLQRGCEGVHLEQLDRRYLRLHPS